MLMIPVAMSTPSCTDVGGICSSTGCVGHEIDWLAECQGDACCVDNIAARCLFCIRPTAAQAFTPAAVPLCEQDAECVSAGGVCQPRSQTCSTGRTISQSHACAQPNNRVCCMGTCPTAVCRQVWGAEEPTEDFTVTSLLPIVVIHQTVSCQQTYNPTACVSAMLRNIQAEHMEDKDLVDIGFDYLIDSAGRLFQGSKSAAINPGVSRDYPGSTLNIAMIGNFNGESASVSAMASLNLTLDCLVGDAVIAGDYVLHADYKLTMCGEQLYTDLTTSSLYQYERYLTAAEKAVFNATLRDSHLEAIMNHTTAAFCELYSDDPTINNMPPCLDDCPECLPHPEVVYILDYLDNPEGAREYYFARGEHYKTHNYTIPNIKKYIKFHVDRLLPHFPHLFLTAFTKMYQFQYQVILTGMV